MRVMAGALGSISPHPASPRGERVSCPFSLREKVGMRVENLEFREPVRLSTLRERAGVRV